MMGRGPEGGCGMQESVCHINSRVLPLSETGGVPIETTQVDQKITHVDFFSQARKALSEKSPYAVPEDASGSGDLFSSNSCAHTLPSGLANLLKQSDSRKKHKKSHLASENRPSRPNDRSKSQSVWVETEEYFRGLALQDVDTLFEVSTAPKWSDYLYIPCTSLEKKGLDNNLRHAENDSEEDNNVDEEESNVNENEIIEIDRNTPQNGRADHNGMSQPYSRSGIVWIASCRNRKKGLLGRPSKERKNSKMEAGFEKILIGAPCEGTSLCDVCCRSDSNGSNQLIKCTSCNISVHRLCYGVRDPGDVKPWLCFSCKQISDLSNEKLCLLCPKKGGALKPFSRDGRNASSIAHLFCAMWMPELYIDDLENMEPIKCVEGAKETKKMLLCCVCKSKCGVCMQCSHGACKATFHPMCGRECGLKMEIWGNLERKAVLLRAFCSKHSVGTAEVNKNQVGQLCIDNEHNFLGETFVASSQASEQGDGLRMETLSYENSEGDATSKLNGNNSTRFSEISDGKRNGDANLSDNLNISINLKKLIDRGKINVEDLAFEIDLSPEFLKTALAENCFTKDVESKICLWLKRHAYMVPPRRITRSSARNSRDDSISSSSKEPPPENGIKGDATTSQYSRKDSESYDENSLSTIEKLGPSSVGKLLSPDDEVEVSRVTFANNIGTDVQDSDCKLASSMIRESNHYIHPSLVEKLKHIEHLENKKAVVEGDRLRSEASYDASVCCNHGDQASNCVDIVRGNDGAHLENPVIDSKLLQIPPADDVEGELLYFQHKLLEKIMTRMRLSGNLLSKVAKNLPVEIEVAKAQRWDAVLVNQYISNIREVKKQCRKERKHKEAQAVLAAATAAAAASVRNPSFRKDSLDEQAIQEKLTNTNGRIGNSSQMFSRPKEALPRVNVSRSSNEKYTNVLQLGSEFSKDNSLSCDVCGRSETILNPIFVCSSCKVAVHLDCYRNVNESTGPWLCEACEEQMSMKSSQAASFDLMENQFLSAECALCGGNSGAFRKTIDNQWVHSFCAEWILESTFRRGQVNPVEAIVALPKEGSVCCVCQQKHGVCVKCGFGHCQATFHPFCARNAGFFLNAKIQGGKHQRKAYCERHSADQRLKAEAQRHGSEDLKNMKQIRVELERLRLLCERIVKREKIKRELVTCSHNILTCKRDHVARSAHLRSLPFPTEVSSESATTSLKVDGYRSFSDAVQRSDDVTVDSAFSVKLGVRPTPSNDTDQRTDDSSTSQNPAHTLQCAGKKIPRRVSPVGHVDDGEWSSGSRRVFEKELMLTSDQASLKNRQLPKGYVYVPVNCREKQTNNDRSSDEPPDRNC